MALNLPVNDKRNETPAPEGDLPELREAERSRFLTREELAEHTGILESERAAQSVTVKGKDASLSGVIWEDTAKVWDYVEAQGIGSFEHMRRIGKQMFAGTLDRITTEYARKCWKSYVNQKSYKADAPQGTLSAPILERETGFLLKVHGVELQHALLFDREKYEAKMQDCLNRPSEAFKANNRHMTVGRGMSGDDFTYLRNGFVTQGLPGYEQGVKPTNAFERQERYAALANTMLAAEKRKGQDQSETVQPWWMDEPIDREEFLREYGIPSMVKPDLRIASEFNEAGEYIGTDLARLKEIEDT